MALRGRKGREKKQGQSSKLGGQGNDRLVGGERYGNWQWNGFRLKQGRLDPLEARRCTVIDYVIRNEAGRKKIIRMKMGESIKLDHLPMEISVEWEEVGKERKGKEGEETKKIVKWDESGIKKYREEIQKGRKCNNWGEMKEKILTALPWQEIKIKEGVKEEEKFLDKECHRSKLELKEQRKKNSMKESGE